MPPYFNISADLDLLPPAVAKREDIETLAVEAEADLINFYSFGPQDVLGSPLHDSSAIQTGFENLTLSTEDPSVFLRFYKVDPTLLTTTQELAFKLAMQRAIAKLITIRGAQTDTNALIKSEGRGRRRVEYFDQANAANEGLPNSVQKWLRVYDARPRVYAI